MQIIIIFIFASISFTKISRLNPTASLFTAAIDGIKQSIQAVMSKNKSKSSRKQPVKPKKPNKPRTGRGQNKSVSAPIAQTVLVRQGPATLSPNRAGTTVVSDPNGINGMKTELVDGAVKINELWEQQVNMRINAANPELFLWLSNIALCYEFYRFRKLQFRYVSRCATTSTGSVQMAVDYDASDAAPANEIVFGSYKSYVDGVCWNTLVCKVDCSAKMNRNQWFYCANALNTNQTTQANNFDMGRFYLYTADAASEFNGGKLYVDYEVELKDPAFPPDGTTPHLGINPTYELSGNHPLGSQTIVHGVMSLKVDTVDGSNVIYFGQVGVFTIWMRFAGTVLTTSPPAVPVAGGGYIATSYKLVNTDRKSVV